MPGSVLDSSVDRTSHSERASLKGKQQALTEQLFLWGPCSELRGKLQNVLQKYTHEFVDDWKASNLDAVICPVYPVPAPELRYEIEAIRKKTKQEFPLKSRSVNI